METARLFVAIEPDERIRRRLWELSRSLAALPIDASCPAEENLHLTLQFIGEVGTRQAGLTALAFQRITFTSFKLSLRGVGTFPSQSFIRVVWAGCASEPADALANLSVSISSALGLKTAETPSPHITLARIKSKRNVTLIQKFVSEHSESKFGSMLADSIKLKRSVPGPGGPTYSDIAVALGS
jgi:2'-5' RNA ligase